MSLRKCTRSRLVPIRYYSFDEVFIRDREKMRKSVVRFSLPTCNEGDINFQNKLYWDVLGLIPDQHKYILHNGIPCRVQTFFTT